MLVQGTVLDAGRGPHQRPGPRRGRALVRDLVPRDDGVGAGGHPRDARRQRVVGGYRGRAPGGRAAPRGARGSRRDRHRSRPPAPRRGGRGSARRRDGPARRESVRERLARCGGGRGSPRSSTHRRVPTSSASSRRSRRRPARDRRRAARAARRRRSRPAWPSSPSTIRRPTSSTARSSASWSRCSTRSKDDDTVKVVVFQSADPDFFLMHGDVEGILAMPRAARRPCSRSSPTWRRRRSNGCRRAGSSPSVRSTARRGEGAPSSSSRSTCASGRRARSWGNPRSAMGILPAAGGTARLPHVVGRSRALDLLLTGARRRGRRGTRDGVARRRRSRRSRCATYALAQALKVGEHACGVHRLGQARRQRDVAARGRRGPGGGDRCVPATHRAGRARRAGCDASWPPVARPATARHERMAEIMTATTEES